MKDTDVVARCILKSAEAYKATLNRRCDYFDYERFKSELLANDCYGYEKQLADILEV